ncbi:fumarylacetoacetate hydrolase family protein [Actinomycetospora flava]|uniref:Fumarylacetoacetate hydrolase family protein n=1 Tax=Actinomycetospora flava TaxID=3129232 RepID=A0ABU8MB32_9PSEU
MRCSSFRDRDGRTRVGVVRDGALRDVTDLLPDGPGSPVRRLTASAPDHRALAGAPEVDPATVEVLPAVPDPTKIVAAPVNYRAHQTEMSSASTIDALGVFLKAPSSLAADRGVVRLPYVDRRIDQEGELAAVIGRTARHVPESEALDVVFGYTGLLDMTMRGGEDRSLRKSFDTFTPLGPTVVTPDEVPPIDELELHLRVNGTLRQRADLRDLIWGLPRLIAYVSSVMTLHPGDVVSTGTPEGVGEVHDGDRIDLSITGLDALTVTVSGEGATTCPTLGAGRGPVPPSELTPVAERRS